MAVRIMRLLCPKRHCIAGLAFDPEKTTEERAKKFIRSGLRATNFSLWCAACGSKDLLYKSEVTPFATIAEATPSIIAEARKYERMREFYENLRRQARKN